MNIPYTDTIFLGLIRMFFWVLFIYILKRLFYSSERSQNQVKVLGFYWSFYGSIVTVLIFVLVLIDSFDLLTMIFILIGFFTLKFLDFQRRNFTLKGYGRKTLSILLIVLRNIERGRPVVEIVKKSREGGRRFGINTEFLVMFSAAVTAVLVRFALMEFDNYQLSPAWFEELSVLNSILEQDWISNKLFVTGEFGLMAFYSLMTGISPEMALESFGLFQIFVLSFVIFWFVDSMTTSLITAPLVAALVFALFFNLAPVNVEQITHSKQTFMALTFWLPAMIYIVRPWKLYQEKSKVYFLSIFLIFFAISLIDFFTFFWLVPPYFVVSLVFLRKMYAKYFKQALFAYLLAVAVILGYYYSESILQDFDFGLFFRSNLLAVRATTTTSNMVLPYDTIVLLFQIISLSLTAIMLLSYRKKKNKWAAPIVLMVYINVLILMSQAGFVYFDMDLFNETSPVLLACSLGVAYYVVYFYYTKYFPTLHSNWVLPPAIFVVFTAISYFSQRTLLERASNANLLSKNVLEAYELIKANYIPYGYAVVNDNELLPISKGSHIFMSYTDFVNDYPERDSIYFANQTNKTFLEENTEYIVPNSVLVFVFQEGNSDFDLEIDLDDNVNQQVVNYLSLLEQTGRPIRVFYNKGGLKVYEIINNPNAAKITELL